MYKYLVKLLHKYGVNDVYIQYSMPIGSELEIDGCVYDDADQIRFDLQSYPKIKIHMKIDKYRMIAMHINPR